MTFEYFRGWISQKPVKLNPIQSDLIQPNPTKKMAWISPARFKTGMEARNP
jgi:hypothetical protein